MFSIFVEIYNKMINVFFRNSTTAAWYIGRIKEREKLKRGEGYKVEKKV